MLLMLLTLLLVALLATGVLAIVAYPHSGGQLDRVPWVGAALARVTR